jgi:predicted small lipoprotein YifL
MRSPFLIAVVLLLAACGKKKPVETPTDEEVPTGFIEIDLSEEEEELSDLVGSELTAAIAPCGDLPRLEPNALMGRLKDAEIRCLDKMYRESDKQTVKKKISLVLMKDAWAKQDLHRWEGIVRRHLAEVDRSDPALCYHFARHLSKKGPDYMEEAITWADIALENRAAWVGDEHVERVYQLRKMKAVAAHREWSWLAEKYTLEPTEELDKKQGAARNNTKTLAREWLDFARTAGRDTTQAFQLCISAAGTDGFCDESAGAAAAGGGDGSEEEVAPDPQQ